MKTLWLLVKRTVQEYGDDNCSHMAAAISYYVLFSIIPLTIFTVSIFGLIVRDDDMQQNIAEDIVEFLNVEEGVPLLVPDEDAIQRLYGVEAVGEIQAAIEDFSPATIEALAAQLEDDEPVTLAGNELTSDEIRVRDVV